LRRAAPLAVLRGRGVQFGQRIVIEKKGCGSGCGTVFALALVVGLIFVYWYIAVAVVGVVAVAALIYRLQVKKKARRRSGPRTLDQRSFRFPRGTWLHRTRSQHGINRWERAVRGRHPGDREEIPCHHVAVSSAEQARAGKTALLAQPKMRDAVKNGRVILEVNGGCFIPLTAAAP